LHDAGNLAVTRLAAEPSEGAAEVAVLALLTAEWGVNRAELLWWRPPPPQRRACPTRGGGATGAGADRLRLHLPMMPWYALLGWRCIRGR
jgi:hypothetical protein